MWIPPTLEGSVQKVTQASEERLAAEKKAKRKWQIIFAIIGVGLVWLLVPAVNPKVPWWSPLSGSSNSK